MKKLALTVLYIGCILLGVGGLGDQFLPGLMPNHVEFLGHPAQDELYFRIQDLVLLMLKVLGGGLMASSVACCFIIHYGVRRQEKWAYVAISQILILSEGWNLFGMYSAGSLWLYPASVLFISFVGLALSYAYVGVRRAPGQD